MPGGRSCDGHLRCVHAVGIEGLSNRWFYIVFVSGVNVNVFMFMQTNEESCPINVLHVRHGKEQHTNHTLSLQLMFAWCNMDSRSA